MKTIPDYRLAVQLSGVKSVHYSHFEEIQKKIYADYLFGTALGEKIHKDKYSLFTFSLLAAKPIFKKEGLFSTDGNWTFRFASAYRDLLLILENAFNCKTVELLKGYEFAVKGVYKEPLMVRNIFQTMPIFMTDKEKNFLTPRSELYYKGIIEGLYNRYEFYNNERPSEDAIKNILFMQKPRQKLIAYKNRNLLSFAGPIKITGDEELIKFAQCVGLGQMPSAGFGMII